MRIKIAATIIQTELWLLLPFFLLAATPEEICKQMQDSWSKVDSYQCNYIAKTNHEGEFKESNMLYSYQKPDKVRMDISKPKKGAILIYNKSESEKVKVRPYPKLRFFVLKFDLTSPRVMSDSGGTIDNSDLGHRMADVCEKVKKSEDWKMTDLKENGPPGWKRIYLTIKENDKQEKYQFTFDSSLLLRTSESFNHEGEPIDSYYWNDLKINPPVQQNLFTQF